MQWPRGGYPSSIQAPNQGGCFTGSNPFLVPSTVLIQKSLSPPLLETSDVLTSMKVGEEINQGRAAQPSATRKSFSDSHRYSPPYMDHYDLQAFCFAEKRQGLFFSAHHLEHGFILSE